MIDYQSAALAILTPLTIALAIGVIKWRDEHIELKTDHENLKKTVNTNFLDLNKELMVHEDRDQGRHEQVLAGQESSVKRLDARIEITTQRIIDIISKK